MSNWTTDELNKIGDAEELQIASRRNDGTLRKRVIIWVVQVGDDLYVRSVNGRDSWWFRGTQTREEGRIWAGGVEKDVTFVEVAADDAIIEQIDAAYHDKYRRWPQYVAPLMTPESRAATLKLVPR